MKKTVGILVITALVLGIGYAGIQFYYTRQLSQSIDGEVARYPGIESVQYEDLHLNLLARTVTMDDVRVQFAETTEPFRIDLLTVTDPVWGDKADGDLFVAAKGIDARHEAIAPALSDLKKLGYGDIKFDVTCLARYNEAEKRLSLDDFQLGAEEMGLLTLKLRMDGINLDGLRGTGQNIGWGQFFGSLAMAKLSGLELTYADRSLAKRACAQKGDDGRDYCGQFLTGINRQLTRETRLSVREVLPVVKTFIENPDKLKLWMGTADPVALLQFITVRDGFDVIELLSIKASI